MSAHAKYSIIIIYCGRPLGVYFSHFIVHLRIITPVPLLYFVIPVRAKPHNSILACPHDEQRHHLAWLADVRTHRHHESGSRNESESEMERTHPEALQTISPAKGERDAEWEREDVVREDVERRAKVLAAQPA